MHLVLALSLALFIQGCSSLKSVEMTPEVLQQQIVSEQMIQVGDAVTIVTADGKQHEFEVKKVDGEQVTGENVVIQIKDIVALQTREFSGGKTALFVGGAVVTWGLIGLISFLSALLAL
ncbi:MAG: hypothetical protein ACI8WB_003512 [Phenylobacterium sp.]|jgi:hypothetical protein